MARKPDTPEQREAKRKFKEQALSKEPRRVISDRSPNETEPMTEPNQNPVPSQDPTATPSPAASNPPPPPPQDPPSAPAAAAAPEPNPEPKPQGNPQPAGSFNPITEDSLIVRDYSTPPVIDPNTAPIEEPVFSVPKLDPSKAGAAVVSAPSGAGAAAGAAGAAAATAAAGANQLIPPMASMQGLSPQERETRATQAVDLALGFYDRLHQFARWYVAVQPEKLEELCMQGKLSLDIQIPLDAEGNRFTDVEKFVAAFNEQSGKALTVNQKFKDEVRPPMIRVFEKNGWGASDEMFLAAKFSEDIAVKVSMMVGMKKSMNRQMNIFMDYYAKEKKANQAPEAVTSTEPEERVINDPSPVPATEKPKEDTSASAPAAPEKQSEPEHAAE